MAHRVGEGCLFPPQNVLREIGAVVEGVTQQKFTLVIFIELQLRVHRHHIPYEVQVTEGHPGFQGVNADAPVCPEYIVHVEFPNPLLGFLLEGSGGRGEIRVLVTEELVRNLAGQKHSNVRVLMDVLAHQIHTDAGTDGGDIKSPQ